MLPSVSVEVFWVGCQLQVADGEDKHPPAGTSVGYGSRSMIVP